MELTMENIGDLYFRYADDLRRVREIQRSRHRQAHAQLDDIEAEITYLLVREARPARVVEIGSFHGWSTTWLLHALHDNSYGELHTYDLHPYATQTITDDRWTFIPGDARVTVDPAGCEYLFIDAAHTASFAHWYTADLFPQVKPGTPVSVHDVFHHSRTLPGHEGRVVTRWLDRQRIGFFTAASRRDPLAYRWLMQAKRTVGLDRPIHRGDRNPMIFFTL
jgi:predicted O-methyltransferase YrrM